MAIVLSGVNNNDRISASDGSLDLISGVTYSGEVASPSFKVGNNIQLGNAGIVTATTFVGNVTGNINNSILLLQTGGTERIRIDSAGLVTIDHPSSHANSTASPARLSLGGSFSNTSAITTKPKLTLWEDDSNNDAMGFQVTASLLSVHLSKTDYDFAIKANGASLLTVDSGNNETNFSTNHDLNINASTNKSGVIRFNNYHTTAAGPNKIILWEAASWSGGFGVSTDHIDYYSGHTHCFYTGTTTSSVGKIAAEYKKDGAVELYHNNVKTFQTTSFGAETIFSSASGKTSIFKVLHGNLSQGVGIGYHSIHATGSNTDVQLKLMSKGSSDLSIQTSADENMAIFRPNESVYLYYNNSQKLKTTNSGVTVTGTVTATSFSGDGSNLTGIVNANVAANAAIAGSKITPNFGSQTLTTGLVYSTGLNSTGTLTLSGGTVNINLNRASHTPTYQMRLTGGSYTTMNFRIRDTTNNLDRFLIRHAGQIEIPGDVGIGHTVNFSNTNITKFGNYSTLHIKGPSNEGAAIRLQDNGDTADSDDFVIYKNQAAAYLRVNGTDPLIAYMNGGERLRITSNGELWVGTTSGISNSGYGGFSLNGSSGSLLSMMHNGTEKLRLFGHTNPSIQYAGYLTFYSGVSGGTERARLSSEGYFTKSNHPGFYAYMDGGNQTTNASSIIPFNLTHFNTGGHFKTSGTNAYKFVCPVSGIYHFSGAIWMKNNSSMGHARWQLRRNNAILLQAGWHQANTNTFYDHSAPANITVYCDANDTVYAYADYQIQYWRGGSAHPHTYFSGHLVG